jgi:exodeoxyribonuclease VII large subunit
LPRGGDSVVAHGRVSVYESKGQYQLIVDNIAPEGIGILQLQFEEMRRRLEAEGLFRAERKRPIPSMPATIGVITSPSGAVWHDIQNIIRRRFPLTRLLLAPSVVQGPDAPVALVAALDALQRDASVDVIVVARGGGSPEDLACFNDERLARALYASRIPVISAVGHETDVTIADLVADVRAPTPSAAAELAVPDRSELRDTVHGLTALARAEVHEKSSTSREPLLNSLSRIARRSPLPLLDRYRQDIDGLVTRTQELVGRGISTRRERTDTLNVLSAHLNPQAVLQRGYAIVATQDNPPQRVSSASAARAAQSLTLAFSDGTVSVLPRDERR